MNSRNNPLRLAGKAWSFLRSGDLSGLWAAAAHRSVLTRWYKDNAEKLLRFDYPLTPESIVFDVGGFQGNFVREMVARYNPRVYVFEPVPEFFARLMDEFAPNPKVTICNYGLSDLDSVSQMALADEASTIYKKGETQTAVRLRDVQAVVQELGISRIDLIKINIEGGEYALLHRMLEIGLVSACQDIQIQFHSFYPDSQRHRSDIRGALQKTHFITYDYPFVWENWQLRYTNRSVDKLTATAGLCTETE